MNHRHWILAIALVVIAILAFMPTDESDLEVVVPARHPTAPTKALDMRLAPAPKPELATVRQAFVAEARTNLFPAQSFRPPPPPPPKIVPVPPPPPMAPPLPFAFIGAWTENGQETVFLSQGDRVLHARKGMTLSGGWRFDSQQPGGLVFTYEPLNQQKTLRIAP